ncbi:MAG: DUF3179 domain-containing (seleno)protein [Bacteroidota bacterium]
MKKYFYIGALGLLVFEVLNVYFIMPMPGSQGINSLNLAYFLYSWRWVFRVVFFLMIAAGSSQAFKTKRKWMMVGPVVLLLLTGAVVYLFNFVAKADKMFLQAKAVVFKSKANNQLPGERLVIGIEHNGEAKAYPVEFIAYHHQVRDSIGGKPVMVTYCSVCRTGRVFEPLVDGNYENFRLVGMDHFNAMFEDETTGSWWRQSTGEAITGKLKGKTLPEMIAQQVSVNTWFEMHPDGKVMQADEFSMGAYDPEAKFEQGKSRGSLTRTDSLSWKDKSWTVGVQAGKASKAYDWNDLKKKGIVNDVIGETPVFIYMASDGKSFGAFERPASRNFTIRHDTLFTEGSSYNLSGQDLAIPTMKLRRINAYQEFWHSWATFHPNTEKYRVINDGH